MTLPGFCASCGHANALHASSGCLWSVVGLGCRCNLPRTTLAGVEPSPEK